MVHTYKIAGMHCGSCVAKISQAFDAAGVDADVTLQPPQVKTSLSDVSRVEAIVAQAGAYSVTSIAAHAAQKSWLATYYPLLLIFLLIALVSLRDAGDIHGWMLHFMAGFFIVFGFFKLLDLEGFKTAYSGYDLLAKRAPYYGYVYPFLEVGLGFAFLFQYELKAALWASIILMTFGSFGVIAALLQKRQIRCACLGTVLNLPMSTITLVEDLGMVAMSGVMLAAMT
ncbi:MAG: heavy metal-associated domain-containing protein [Pseudomonadota bacterium]